MRGSLVMMVLHEIAHISSGKVSGIAVKCLGQSLWGSLSHLGPSHHKWCSSISEGNMPQEAQSAGFSELITWFQQSGEARSMICATGLPTYTLKRRGLPCNQPSTLVESVQANMDCIATVRTSLQWASNCDKVSAPQSSRRGIVCLLIGATLVLDITNEVCMLPLESSIRR